MSSIVTLWSNWEQKELGKHLFPKCNCPFHQMKTIIKLSPEVMLVQYHQNKWFSWFLNQGWFWLSRAQQSRAGSEYLEALSWELGWDSWASSATVLGRPHKLCFHSPTMARSMPVSQDYWINSCKLPWDSCMRDATELQCLLQPHKPLHVCHSLHSWWEVGVDPTESSKTLEKKTWPSEQKYWEESWTKVELNTYRRASALGS